MTGLTVRSKKRQASQFGRRGSKTIGVFVSRNELISELSSFQIQIADIRSVDETDQGRIWMNSIDR